MVSTYKLHCLWKAILPLSKPLNMEKKAAYTFTSADAENYDHYLGPVMFEPYGEYLATQIDAAGPC